MRTYLVTGGLGFLGAHLAVALVRAGHRVRVLDDLSRGSADRLGACRQDVEIINADIRDPAAVLAAVRGVDSVCHLAFVNGTEHFYSRPAHVLDVAVKGMVNVLDSCRHASVGELLLASSSEVYQTPPVCPTDEAVAYSIPDPLNPRYSYAGGKIISELMAIHYGQQDFERVVIVRPHNVYGPDMGWEHVIPQLTTRLVGLAAAAPPGEVLPLPIQGTGDQTRAFVYVDDFTDALVLLLDKGEHLGIYNVGTMEEVTIRELAHAIAGCLGARVRIVPGPAPAGATPRRCPDTARLARLGFRPRFSLPQGLRPTVEWYAAHVPPAR